MNFSQPIRDNVNESIAGQSGQIALKLFADDLDLLQETATAAKRALSRVPGVADLGLVKSGVVPRLAVHPRRESLGRFGLTLEEFQSYLATALGGQVVETLWEGDRSFDVVLRLPVAARDTVEEISALRVPTPSGALVPLPALADVGIDRGGDRRRHSVRRPAHAVRLARGLPRRVSHERPAASARLHAHAPAQRRLPPASSLHV